MKTAKKIQRILLPLIFLCNSFFYTNQAQTKNETFDDNYKNGMICLTQNDTTGAILNFKNSIKNKKNEFAYYQLSKICFCRGDFDLLLEAKENIDKAIKLNSENADYWYWKGLISERLYNEGNIFYTGERQNAIDCYEKAVALDDNYIEAHFRLGVLYKEDFLEFNNSAAKFNSPVRFSGYDDIHRNKNEKLKAEFEYSASVDLDYGGFSAEVFDKSEKHFIKVIELDPNNIESQIDLALMYLKAKNYNDGISVLEKLEKDGIEEIRVYQYLGIMHYENRDNDEAYKYFQKAINLMNDQEKKDFKLGSTKILLESFLKEKMQKMSLNELYAYADYFWKFREPLFSTEYNERILEHYYRVAYANLFFGVDALNIPGWKTNRGEMFIRYGKPKENIHFRRKQNILGKDPRVTGYLNVDTEVWNYNNFTLAFVDPYRNDNYQFSTPSASDERMASQYFGDTKYFVEEELRKKTPEQYTPSFGGPILEMYTRGYLFKHDEEFVDYIVCYGVPKDTVQSDFKTSVFIMDDKLKKLKSISERWAPMNINKELIEAGKSSYLVNSNTITYGSYTGWLALELLRIEDEGVAGVKSKVSFDALKMDPYYLSDIVIAYDVVEFEEQEYPLKRGDVKILPNPSHRVSHEEPFFIYYEVYNLDKGEDGLTKFEQKIEILQTQNSEGPLNAVSDFLGLSSSGEKVSMITEYQTLESNVPVYLKLNLENYTAGNYKMKITITDKEKGVSLTKEADFTINEKTSSQ